MLNCAIVMGRICNDLELKKTPSGVSVTRFSVAVDRGYTKQGEEKKTDFIQIVVWGKSAEFVCNYFSKGSMIAVQGAIETSSYVKNGYTFYSWEIKADNVSFCEGKKNDGQSNNSSQNEPQATESTYSAEDFTAIADDDDVPF